MQTILLLDDDVLLSSMLERVLTRKGYRVLRAETIAAGVAVLAGGGVNVAAFDISLPDGNGWDVLRELRADPDARRSALPVVMLSSYTEDRALTRQLHVAGYIQKPFSTHTFVRIIEDALHTTPPNLAA